MSDQASARRGLALITLAKLYFIVMGFAVQLGLPRLLSPVVYGRYALAMSFVSLINNVLIAATVQSVSKRVSENQELAGARLRQGLYLQLAIGLVLSLGLMGSAPWLAAYARSPDLTALLRVVALVPLFYALYAALIGSLNGRQLFKRQALLDASFTTLRTVGMLGAAALGFGALGVVSGFAGAAFGVLLAAFVLVGIGQPGPTLPLRQWFQFMLPVVLFQLGINGMLLLDIWVLQNTVAELGSAAGLAVDAAAQSATELVGFYKTGRDFATVPYQVILSVTFVVFPLVSRATAAGDLDAARTHIRGALRFSILVLFGLAAPLGGGAEALVRLAFPKYLAGAEALGVLWVGQLALALFVIIATILSGAGRPGVTVFIGATGLAITLGLNRLLVQWVGIGPYTLRAAALATSLGTLSALLVAAFALRKLLGTGLPLLTLARAALGGAAAFAAARLVPQHSGLIAPVVLIAGVLVYGGVLVATGELGRADLERVLEVVRKRRK
jgi:stage V sporulation protein B